VGTDKSQQTHDHVKIPVHTGHRMMEIRTRI